MEKRELKIRFFMQRAMLENKIFNFHFFNFQLSN